MMYKIKMDLVTRYELKQIGGVFFENEMSKIELGQKRKSLFGECE